MANLRLTFTVTHHFYSLVLSLSDRVNFTDIFRIQLICDIILTLYL